LRIVEVDDIDKKHHDEVVVLYKERIFNLELELEQVMTERNDFRDKLFELVGLKDKQLVNNENHIRINRPPTPLRMRSMLEAGSRVKVNETK